jgi:hypothetical protein
MGIVKKVTQQEDHDLITLDNISSIVVVNAADAFTRKIYKVSNDVKNKNLSQFLKKSLAGSDSDNNNNNSNNNNGKRIRITNLSLKIADNDYYILWQPNRASADEDAEIADVMDIINEISDSQKSSKTNLKTTADPNINSNNNNDNNAGNDNGNGNGSGNADDNNDDNNDNNFDYNFDDVDQNNRENSMVSKNQQQSERFNFNFGEFLDPGLLNLHGGNMNAALFQSDNNNNNNNNNNDLNYTVDKDGGFGFSQGSARSDVLKELFGGEVIDQIKNILQKNDD